MKPGSAQNPLETIAGMLLELQLPHPLRVGVDGIDAAGKTHFVNQLARVLAPSGRQILQISLDGFHNPRRVRYARGKLSPAGYYQDSFDLGAFRKFVLDPLGPGGDLLYRTAVFDHRTDSPLQLPDQKAASDAILLCDGIFLHRPELVEAWDFTIFLDIPFELSLERALIRDLELLGSAEAVAEHYRQRYIPAQISYLETCHPRESAAVLVDNTDPLSPRILRT